MTGSVARASRDATPSLALRVVWRTVSTTAASARRSSEMCTISEKFTVVAAFSNVHGVYKAGNVKLQPEMLATFQEFASHKVGQDNPLFFVHHGGSVSEKHDIATVLGLAS